MAVVGSADIEVVGRMDIPPERARREWLLNVIAQAKAKLRAQAAEASRVRSEEGQTRSHGGKTTH